MEEIELKTYPKYFQSIIDGVKTFELRKDDRNFQVGDIVKLKEFDNIKYSGREVIVRIIYVLKGGLFGLEQGHCIFSFELISKEQAYEK